MSEHRIKEKYGIKLPVTTITLVWGRWARIFDQLVVCEFISEALNGATTDERGEHPTLAGYYLDHTCANLVFRLDEGTVHEILERFRLILEDIVKRGIEGLKKTRMMQSERDQLMEIDLFPRRLFEIKEFWDDHLIRLITGQQINLPYDDPKLDRLKNRISDYRFCSAPDYAGAIGPVVIKQLKREKHNLV